MSAVTLAFFLAASEPQQPLVIFGPATPINEQLDAAQDWAGKELVPVAGITSIEVWTPTGVRARYNFPEHATVDTETPWGVTVPASEASELLTEIEALKVELEKAKANIETLEKELEAAARLGDELRKAMATPIAPIPPAQEPPAEPEAPVLTLPPDGGPAKPAKGKAAAKQE